MDKLGFNASKTCPQLLLHEEQGTRIAIHVDDPLASGPEDKVASLYEHLGQWLTVRMGLPMGAKVPTKYLGCKYYRLDSEIVEAPTEGYVDAMAGSWMCPTYDLSAHQVHASKRRARRT